MANLLNVRPDEPTTQIVEFGTNIFVSHDGLEQRAATKLKPRQSYEYDILLPSEDEIRKFRAALFNDLDDVFQVPLWHETVRITNDVPVGFTIIEGDFTFTDLAAGEDILLMDSEDAVFEVAEVNSIAAGQITVTTGTTFAYPPGSVVVPIVEAFAQDNSGYQRFPTKAATMPLSLDLRLQLAVGGAGAPSITLHDSLNVLDRRHLNDQNVSELFNRRITRMDFGRKFEVLADFGARTKIGTARQYLIDSKSELQYWKSFLTSIVGMREPFFAPTFRPDLVLDSQPAQGGSTITVSDEPDFKVEYEGSTAHEDLQFESGGILIHRGIASSVDNGDGTITITLDAALPGSFDPITTVSFLERSRLGSDQVTFTHFNTFSIVQIAVQSIQR